MSLRGWLAGGDLNCPELSTVQFWMGFVACTEFLHSHPTLSNWFKANTRHPTLQSDYNRQISSESKPRAIRPLIFCCCRMTGPAKLDGKQLMSCCNTSAVFLGSKAGSAQAFSLLPAALLSQLTQIPFHSSEQLMYVDMSQIREEIRMSDQPGREDDTNTSFCIENKEDTLMFLHCNL